MKVRFLNYHKYRMSKMPLKFYLPKVKLLFKNKVWHFIIFRDYGIELDFRKKDLIDLLLTKKEKNTFFKKLFLKFLN